MKIGLISKRTSNTSTRIIYMYMYLRPLLLENNKQPTWMPYCLCCNLLLISSGPRDSNLDLVMWKGRPVEPGGGIFSMGGNFSFRSSLWGGHSNSVWSTTTTMTNTVADIKEDNLTQLNSSITALHVVLKQQQQSSFMKNWDTGDFPAEP